ncbi:mge1, partial [Symbiodinium sp. CCMP2456]
AVGRMIDLYFFTDRATTKDVVLLPALCHDVALFSIAVQLLLLMLILCYVFFKALAERLANLSRARSTAAEEAADEQAPKFRIELQPPCKCLRFAVKWDPDMRNMINSLKEEGEEALTPFFESEVFVWKLRKYVRNMVSKADRLNLKRDVIQRRQQRELNERTAQKTAEQEMQDRQALLELFGQVDQPVAAAQAPLVQEQAPVVEPSEKPAASTVVPVVEEEDTPDPFLKMLAATSQKKPTDPQMSPEDAAALASMMAEGPTSGLTEARQPDQPMDAEAPEAFGHMLSETSQMKPVEAQMSPEDVAAMASMMAEQPPSSTTEAPQSEQSVAGESPDAFMTMLMETSRKKLADTQMSPADAAAMAAMMSVEQPLKAEAPNVQLALNETSEKKPIDARLSQEDAAALACLMAEEPASNSTETPQAEVPSAEESACDTDGWDCEDFWALIDSTLPPEEAAAQLFTAMGIPGDLAFATRAPVVPTNTIKSEDPFKDFWDSLDDNMSPELVAAKLVNTAQFIQVKKIRHTVEEALAKFGITKMKALDADFDPAHHEAMFAMEMPGKEPNKIFHVMEPGYMIHDRTLRAAKVGVTK